MRKNSAMFMAFAMIMIPFAIGAKVKYDYGIAPAPWAESLGNHRAVLKIDRPADVVALDFEWRRPDPDPDKRRMLIVDGETGDTVRNVRRLEVNGERCRLLFGPVKRKGTYYFYYLPYMEQKQYGAYQRGYYPPEEAPATGWCGSEATKGERDAKVIRVESRTEFDSFFPMEVTATAAETARYGASGSDGFFIFPEDRRHPVRMRDKLPEKWLSVRPGDGFRGEARPNEYYAFQIALWSPRKDIGEVTYRASDLKAATHVIPSTAVTCFNTEGTDPYGVDFKKKVEVKKDEVRPLWFGIDLPADAPAGTYRGTVEIISSEFGTKKVPVSIKVGGPALADRGDSEPWRHSRLRWLNSTLGLDDTPTRGYVPMTVGGNTVGCLGRRVEIAPSSLLPAQITSWGTRLFNAPMRFVVETEEGIRRLEGTSELTESTPGHVSGIWSAHDGDVKVTASGRMEFDGWMGYTYTVETTRPLKVKDVRLEITMDNDMARYFLGAGLPGQETPDSYEGKWDRPEVSDGSPRISLTTDRKREWLWPFDSFWIGDAGAGVHCELRGTTYSGPLLNAYRPAYPESWHNGGKGGFRVEKGDSSTTVVCYSGERIIMPGTPVDYEFALLITPVKETDMKSQFTDRYYHNGGKPVPTDEDVKAGVKVINIHHANEYNPFINYPFLRAEKMKDFTDEWHAKGCKVKLYYTLRELTSAFPEIWAIRSLGDEVIRDGGGGGYPWCREHLQTGYTPQWYSHFDHPDESGISADAALLTSESASRWYNYYVEGLKWMVENMGIDGIYLDDVSYDRRILKRMRRAMDSVKPGCLIDLHSNTGFSRGPANQYAEFFPYIDKVWFGESFLYDRMTPANWLVESSGIPFGLMGDMLYRGGNKWLGMQYGMTVRHPWETEGVICDPRLIWKIWDDFGIAESRMIGFWDARPAVTASDSAVKVTAFIRPERALLSLGNYSDEAKDVTLTIDWKRLGMDPENVRLVATAIKEMQPAMQWEAGESLKLEPRKGWLIYVEQK